MAIPTTNQSLQPHQVRAARAIADVSMETLAALAGLSGETVLRLEKGATAPSRSTAARLVHAFALLGVEILDEDGAHGAGARMREPGGAAAIARRDALRGGREIGVVLRIGGKPATARVVAEALAPGGEIGEALLQFDSRRVEIAGLILDKLQAGAVDADGHVRLAAADFASAERAA
jgi:DNA-binding XRE family transcriptional regulator